MQYILNLFTDIIFKGKIPYFSFWGKIILFLSFVPFVGIFIFPEDFRNLGTYCWSLLLFILFLRPLSDIFTDLKILKSLLAFRKELGILCGSLGISHGIGFFLDNKTPLSEWFQADYLWDFQQHYFWGVLGFFIVIILTLTSNIFSVKVLKKYWKKMHKLTYIFLLVVAIHIVLIKGGAAGNYFELGVWEDVFPIFILLFLWFLSSVKFKISFKNILKKDQKIKQNVFEDSVLEKNSNLKEKRIQVDRENCIGCTNCTRVCPNVFEMKDGKSFPKNQPKKEDLKNAELAIQQCPVNVISWGESKKLKVLNSKFLTFQSQQKLNKEVSLFTFKHEGLDFISGQFLTLLFEIEEAKIPRSYSIFSADNKTVTFCIHLLEKGKGSQKLMRLKKNEKLEYKGPFGNIKLQENNFPKIFIGTGTGVAPLYCMIKNMPEKIEKALFFGVRSEENLFLKSELENIKGLSLFLTLSRPSDFWKGLKGRVTDHLLDKKFPKGTEFYICGNPRMVDSVQELLIKKGVSEKKIFLEHFA